MLGEGGARFRQPLPCLSDYCSYRTNEAIGGADRAVAPARRTCT